MTQYDKLPFFKNLILGRIYWIDADIVSEKDIFSYIKKLISENTNSDNSSTITISYDDQNIINMVANLYRGKFRELTSSIIFENIILEMKKQYSKFDRQGCNLKLYHKNTRTEKVSIDCSILPLVIITNNKPKILRMLSPTKDVHILTQNEYFIENTTSFKTIVIDENKTNGYETLIKNKDFNRVIFIHPKSKIEDHNLLRIRKIDNSYISVLHIIKLFHTFFKIIAPNYDYHLTNFSLSLTNYKI